MVLALALAAAAAASDPTLDSLAARVSILEAQADEHAHDDEHSHGAGGIEWGGVYDLFIGTYTWTFSKNERAMYGAPDASMRTIIMRGAGGDTPFSEMLTDMRLQGESLMRQNCQKTAQGTHLTPGDLCYELVFDDAANATSFVLSVGAAGHFVIFTEHGPSEFDAELLGTPAGLLVGPVATQTVMHAADHAHAEHEHEHEHETAPSNLAIAALVLAVAANLLALGALACLARHGTGHPRGRMVIGKNIPEVKPPELALSATDRDRSV